MRRGDPSRKRRLLPAGRLFFGVAGDCRPLTNRNEPRLNPLDVVWHLCNLFLPAWVVAGLMAGALKLLWRERARGMSWRQLTWWGAAGGSMAAVFAMLLLGRDGSMVGYGLILLGVTIPQWGLTWRTSPNS